MPEYHIALPSKPRIVKEDEDSGVYEIDGLYPGYGHTLGNSLRRIILSSLPGAAITSIKIDGISHEFSTIAGVKEDVITILLNLKKVRFLMSVDEPQEISLSVKGARVVTAADLKIPSQLTVLNPDQRLFEITDAKTSMKFEGVVERGLGYLSKDALQKERVEIGTIALDAIFAPIRRVNYEVENMRVGDRTDFNRLRIIIETDGSLSPREALERSIETMIYQLKAVVGFKEEAEIEPEEDSVRAVSETAEEGAERHAPESDKEFLKTRIESLELSARTVNALSNANIRTVGGLVRKKESDILALEGLGPKGVQEIKRALSNYGIVLK